jgi:Mn2+/Fe2+ NRAMP family transporter
MSKKDTQKIMQEFLVRRTRQLIAIGAAAILVLLVAMLYKRSDLFGEFSKNTLAFAQILIILAFINFTAFNWRCPSCKKYMGNDMNPRGCKKCGVRLQ